MYYQLIVVLAYVASSMAQYPVICPAIYAPVCGTDGKTYSSECVLGGARRNNPNLQVAYRGRCLVKRDAEHDDICGKFSIHLDNCPREMEPVCASNGQTFKNLCQFCYFYRMFKYSGSDVSVKHEGTCPGYPSTANCNECKRGYEPVCASNGQTFDNHCDFCFMYNHLKNEGVDISVKYEGKCELVDFCPSSTNCSDEYKPVCPYDRQYQFDTFNNYCLYCAAMSGRELSHIGANEGACLDPENMGRTVCRIYHSRAVCNDHYKPLCASDGKTYNNTCLYCHASLRVEKNGVVLNKEKDGEC